MIPNWLHKHPKDWPPNAHAAWDERAAIMEHLGNVSKETAERRATMLVRKQIADRGER